MSCKKSFYSWLHETVRQSRKSICTDCKDTGACSGKNYSNCLEFDKLNDLDDKRLADLLHDMYQDKNFPKQAHAFNRIYNHLASKPASYKALDAFESAYILYLKEYMGNKGSM